MVEKVKILLGEEDLPGKWYNIVSDIGEKPPPMLNPASGKPIGVRELSALFPEECARQEFKTDAYIDIPEEVKSHYLRFGRPTPLYRARKLEERLKTPAKIYLKREDVSPTGSHKVNTAIAQAYYASKEGMRVLTTETGAGQWGSALSLACRMTGIECMVYMVRVSYMQKPYRKYVMMLYGARVVPSPSSETKVGRKFLEENPQHPGSLGIAISEAIETAVTRDDAKYSLGSVLNFVLLHQTIIGLEALTQFEQAGIEPDVMIGCVGGGSNFAGFTFPAIGRMLGGKLNNVKFIAVEPEACPSMTKGEYKYDFGDTAETTPLLKMFTLGHNFVPPPIHAGGLRYHGAAPLVSLLKRKGIVKSITYRQEDIFTAGKLLAETEGLIPAPETCHAVAAAIDYALKCKEKNESLNIVLNYSGHGLLDLHGYSEILGLS